MTHDKFIYCDKCKKKSLFSKITKKDKVEGDVNVVYIQCPECGHKYLSYYTNAKVKGLQKLQLKVKKLLKKETERLKDVYGADLNKDS